MAFKHFSLRIGLRIALLALTLAAWISLLILPGYPTLTLVMTAVVVVQVGEIFRFVSKTNAELTRFLDAVRYADFGQRFQMRDLGAGFDGLGEAFTDIIERFQAERAQREEELRHLKALTEHVPVPLLSLHRCCT